MSKNEVDGNKFKKSRLFKKISVKDKIISYVKSDLPLDIYFFPFLFNIRMVAITVKLYQDANVDIMPDENKEFFWVKMIDMQNGLGIKNMPQMVSQEILGIFGTKNLNKEQKNNI